MECFKAQIAGDSSAIDKICSAEAAHLDHWIAAHDSINVSSQDREMITGEDWEQP